MPVNNMSMGPLVINIRKREQIQVVASLEGTIHSSPLSLYFVKVPPCITGKSLKAAVWLGLPTNSLKNMLKSNQLKKMTK